MDTGTHVVMGVGLGGLAMLDPVVAHSPAAEQTVFAATLIGSLAPDFDTIFKLKDNAVYIKQHRGFSHSLPALLIWSLLIWGTLVLFNPVPSELHLWLWSLAAVCLHVFVDLFNAYGTQALRPFSRRWIAFGIINIFDPAIFFLHAAGIAFWALGLFPPGPTFLAVYTVLFFYYFWRYFAYKQVQERVISQVPDAEYVNLSPTIRWTQWHASAKTPDAFYVLQVSRNEAVTLDRFKPKPFSEIPKQVLEDENVRAFLNFSPIYIWDETEYPDLREIRLVDLRYRNRAGHYPFVAIALLDEQDHVVSSFTGWVHSERKLQKKLELQMDVN
ncbi:MAG TPA: metal-dependent hydrolase [Bacillales bacterium]|nr:metal-dependent hydrolase [Bacillales bacterium]